MKKNKVTKSNTIENKRFDTINGLRTIACLGIVLMHISANVGYLESSNCIVNVISQFTNFVFLFMTISAFGICCGYFDKIKNHEISPEKFYSKRILKILPFFLFLIVIDIIIEHSIPSLIEGFADATLLFGLLQKNISVIGVAWFIGLVFIFYIIFPYFTYLFSSKKKACVITIIALLMNLSCTYYFDVGRENMFYSFIYFCIGGLIYLYKNEIINIFKNKKILSFIFIIISIKLYFINIIDNQYMFLFKNILLIVSLLCYAISCDSKILNNKFTKFIGNISFEIYLCHMFVFRIFEKINLINVFSNSWLSYIFISILVIFGSICMSLIFKKIYSLITKKVFKNANSIC